MKVGPLGMTVDFKEALVSTGNHPLWDGGLGMYGEGEEEEEISCV